MTADFQAAGIQLLFVSADSPETSAQFRRKFNIQWTILADANHAVADQYRVPISRFPKKTYSDGFIQPAFFAYKSGNPVYQFIQNPALLNGYGAMNRPSPKKLLELVSSHLEGGGRYRPDGSESAVHPRK